MTNIKYGQCFLCWKNKKFNSLYIFSHEDRTAFLCSMCIGMMRNKQIILDYSSASFVHEIILKTNELVFKIGIERMKAIKLVLNNVNQLNLVDEIALNSKFKMHNLGRVRLEGVLPDEKHCSNDIYDRSFRLPGSFERKK